MRRGERITLYVAATVLFGTLLMGLGTTWDLSWHTHVGRDTVWNAPHLVDYLSMLAGLPAAGLGVPEPITCGRQMTLIEDDFGLRYPLWHGLSSR